MTLLPLAPPSAVGQPTAVLASVPSPRSPADTLSLQHTFEAPTAAETALTSVGGADRDAIVWLSEHLATLDRVIYLSAARRLPTASFPLRTQRERSRALALLLRRLHAQLDGDGANPAEDVPSLRRTVLAALREHTASERELTAQLHAVLTVEQWQDLTGTYTSRLQRGPTRPHPHAPRAGLVRRIAYFVSARTDRILDVLDSRATRPVPTLAH